MENHHNPQDHKTLTISFAFTAISWLTEHFDKVMSNTAALVAIVAGAMAAIHHFYAIKKLKEKG